MEKNTFYLFKLTTLAFALPKGVVLNSASAVKTTAQVHFTTSTTLHPTDINATSNTNTNDYIS